MRVVCCCVLILLGWNIGWSQVDVSTSSQKQKGKFYLYWGWNYGYFSKSDIHFKGEEYDFELKDVVATDRQSDFSLETYFHPVKFTIPQYNVRLGYFLNENYQISLGMDHMKYVVQRDQLVEISGEIKGTETTYNGIYDQSEIQIKPDFLQFEHTDGLNFVNAELRRQDDLFSFPNIKITLNEGLGLGVLVPKTNATLLSKERHDAVHLAGFGLGGVAALQVQFFNRFFIQTEVKGGYINMSDIRTTQLKTDSASQDFFYAQWNVVFGYLFRAQLRKNGD